MGVHLGQKTMIGVISFASKGHLRDEFLSVLWHLKARDKSTETTFHPPSLRTAFT